MPPRPCHYIIRPGPTATLPSGGTVQGPASLVPLIAVDQLPPFFEIVGAPRRLSPEDAVTMVAVAAWHTSATRPLGADDIYAIRIHVGDSPTPGDAVDAKDDESGGARLDGVVPCAQTPSRKATPTKAQTAVGTAVSTGSLTTPDAATLLSSGAVADPSSRNQDYRQMLARLTASPAAAVRAEAAITGSATASPNSSSALQGSSSNPAVVPGVAAKKQNRGPGQWRAGGKKTAVTAAVVAEGPATPAARGSRGGISDVDSNSSSGGSGQGKSLAWPQHMRKGISAVLPCKHWCHYGRCSYEPKCIFSHVMPTTLSGLHAVGLEHFPPWWTKKQTAPGIGQGEEGHQTVVPEVTHEAVIDARQKSKPTSESLPDLIDL